MKKLLGALALVVAAGAFTAPVASAAPAVGDVQAQAAFYSGTIAAGGTQTWHWNNANPHTTSYVVGLSPKGASTTADCQFEVTRTWYAQQYGGEREFWWTIKNVGGIACATDINLYALPKTSSWSTGGVNPGQSKTYHWNNANPANSTYVVGFAPNGATNSAACQFETTREWYVEQPGGEREFYFTVRNAGSIACTADILLSAKTTNTSFSTGYVAAGASAGKTWNNANPLTAAYIVGFSSVTPNCQFEVTRSWYAQRINATGSTEREFRHTIRNAGAVGCSATEYLATA